MNVFCVEELTDFDFVQKCNLDAFFTLHLKMLRTEFTNSLQIHQLEHISQQIKVTKYKINIQRKVQDLMLFHMFKFLSLYN